MKYLRRSEPVDAVQLTRDFLYSVPFGHALMPNVYSNGNHAIIRSNGDPIKAQMDDWIVTDSRGNLHAVKPEIFDALYQAI